MGNLISNSCDANNPTYEYKIVNGTPVLCEKTNADYDWEEYKFKSPKEAKKEIPQLLEKEKEYLTTQIEKVYLDCETEMKRLRNNLQNVYAEMAKLRS